MNKKLKSIALLMACLVMGTLLTGFSLKNTRNSANYQVYIGYPKGYLSEFNNAHSVLKNDKNEIITRFGGDNATEGTLGRGVQNSGRGVMEVPSKIEVMWFSVPENQFWHAEFELPKQAMIHGFKQKVLDVFGERKGKSLPQHDEIIVNVAPKGKVYVYLGGWATKLIATGQAKPIQYDWFQHINETWAIKGKNPDTQAEFVTKLKRSYASVINQVDQYYKEAYFNPVRWKLSIKGDKKIIAYLARTLNGENYYILGDTAAQEIQSIPTQFVFDVDDHGKVGRYKIKLGNAYNFYQQNFSPKAVVEIIIDIPDPDHGFVYFQQGNKTVEFKDFTISEMDR